MHQTSYAYVDPLACTSAGPFFLAQMDARATVIFRDFAPQHISVLLWATAKLGHNPGPHLLTAAISTATAEMANFNPQNVANSLWAYATLGFYPGHAFMAAAAHRQLADMSVGLAACGACVHSAC